MAQQHKSEKEQVKMQPRIGRWKESQDGKVRLIASRCASCGEVVFPERSLCPRCRSNVMEEVPLSGPVSLYSFTVVHQLPAGFTSPMVVGYGRFEEGVLIFAPIDGEPESLKPGLPLELHTGVTRVDANGEPMVTYRFRPAVD